MDPFRRLFESKEEWEARVDREEYEAGQKAGSEASALDEALHDQGGHMFHSEKWNQGYANGADNKPKD